ncbi:hypothetical protein IGI04_015200 [Brassica rapa subsp. trilocularis]|uniref:Uncharacterized protein n=1 Tax=Brassica rapa subsp. trilocularis TaxID=1813537 RepID=A0ABQ7MPC4_BRACM|nr:hypothetical protein IGI04_015200 [Brassica rapa subsp. trilocularis]
MSTESACGWSVPSLTGNLSKDLSVPRLWRREGLNRHQSSQMLAQIDGVFYLFFLEARVPARISWSHPDPPCSCEVMWLVLSRGYVWEASSFGVVGRVLEVSVAAREGSRDSIRVSLVSMSPRVGFLIVATFSLALGPLASSKVASSGEGVSGKSHYSAYVVG